MINFNFIVYFIGVVIFAVFYESVKQALGGGLLFFISAIAYLVSLRALGYLLEHRSKQPEDMGKE